MYLSMILTVMLNAYALRLRHYFAGYFYEEREKDRVKFLHRKLLRRRVITLKELKVFKELCTRDMKFYRLAIKQKG